VGGQPGENGARAERLAGGAALLLGGQLCEAEGYVPGGTGVTGDRARAILQKRR
jgi:hypothetical protein